MRTIKELINSGEHLEDVSIRLKDGRVVDGLLIQERVDKSRDTVGYHVYDIRTGETEDGIELFYATIEPRVLVNWADSIATKEALDFGDKGFLEIDNEDVIEYYRQNT